MNTWPFVCGICQRSYTGQQWLELPADGRFDIGTEHEADQRTCECGGSHSVLVSDLPNGDRLDFEEKRAERIARMFQGARSCLHMARVYQREDLFRRRPWRDDHRITHCLEQAKSYRAQIARLRVMQFTDIDTILLVALQAHAAE